MRKSLVALAIASLVLALYTFDSRTLLAATPSSGTISPDSPRVEWTGGPFLVSSPTVVSVTSPGSGALVCRRTDGTLDEACDHFKLTIVPPAVPFAVRIRIEGANLADDYDLYVFDPNGRLIDQSATGSGIEESTLSAPPAGTYTVSVQPFLVVPGSTYKGVAFIDTTVTDLAKAYRGTRVGADFDFANVIPANGAAPFHGPPLQVSFAYVGRRAGEPTIGANRRNTGFFVAATFDSVAGVPGVVRTARSVVLRSRDKGLTWEATSPILPGDLTTEPPTTLDPYLHVDTETGRVFSIDLYVACSWMVFSDDEGASWQRNVLACGDQVNDHHTILTAPAAPGLSTTGYPRMLYYCFNRVGDSSCGRSHDGGVTFVPTRDPAFLGVNEDGELCGGLHGHLAADSTGRIFLPKGHCDFPWVAISEDGGDTWTRVKISGHIPMPHHEVSVAVDASDNLYAVYWDARWRLPFLSVSTDHGRTWSTPLMIAPPGVHEVNFPTIAAGDAGRIAITFPGTTVKGTNDSTRPWNSYVLVSTNALDPDPLFVWTTANDPADPVHRGDCGPGRCGGMLDFLDIQVSPADGAFWATASDTCVGSCVTNPSGSLISPGEGVAIRQTKGPSLWAPGHKPPK